MIVDRVARAMTAGAPRPGFTERVMAPIDGRPRPGFTSRVMAGLDAPERTVSTAWPRLALATLATAVLAVAAWSVATQPGIFNREEFPGVPPVPAVTPRPYLRAAIDVPPLPLNRWAPAPRPAATPAAPFSDPPPSVEGETIYRIAAIEPPAPLSMKPLAQAPTPAPPVVLSPLPAPAPLSVPSLRLDKETP